MRRLVQGLAPTALALDVEPSTALGFFSGDKHLACLFAGLHAVSFAAESGS